jgi:hypothetical protein
MNWTAVSGRALAIVTLTAASACRNDKVDVRREVAPAASADTLLATPARLGVPHVAIARSGAVTFHIGPPHDTAEVDAFTWNLARVEARLRDAGFTSVRENGEVRQPFMGATGARLFIAGRTQEEVEVEAFVYADQAMRASDTDRLDPVRVAPPTMIVSWRVAPSLVVNNNLALIVLASNATLRARIRQAISGGRGQ